MDRPVLFCYDGSEGSKAALSVAVELVDRAAAGQRRFTAGRGAE